MTTTTASPTSRERTTRRRITFIGLPLGLLALAVSTLVATQVFSIANVFLYDSILLAAMGSIALTVLIGTAGQVSIGNSAFLAVGAFTSVWATRAGMPTPVDIVLALVVSVLLGVIVGLAGLRMRGLEFALATLAAFFIVVFLAHEYQKGVDGAEGGFTVETWFSTQPLEDAQTSWAWLLTGVLAVIVIGAHRLTGSKNGRAMRMIRDHEIAAPALGIPVLRTKLVVFALSSGVLGLQGALTGHLIGSVASETFTLTLAIQYLAMVVIGGLGSITGAVIGAAVVVGLPMVASTYLSDALGGAVTATEAAQLAGIAYMALVIGIVVFAPKGLASFGRHIVDATSRFHGSRRTRPAPVDAAGPHRERTSSGGAAEVAHQEEDSLLKKRWNQ